MATDVMHQCLKCKSCSVNSKTKRHQEPIVPLEIQAFRVGELWRSDLFTLRGKHYLVWVDKVSWLILCDVIGNQKADTVTRQLEAWIAILGLPSVLKTDSGPCYTAGVFDQFCRKMGIEHVQWSAFNPKSNGQSERAVGELKVHLERSGNELNINQIVHVLNSTERSGGFGAPLNIFLGRNSRSVLPNSENCVIDVAANIQKREERVEKWAKKTNKKYNREKLKIGDEVVLKNNVTNKWDITGVIVESRESILTRNGATAPVTSADSQSCTVRSDQGGLYTRNKCLVKKKTY